MNLKDFYRVLKAVSDLLNKYDPTPHYQQLTQLLEQIRSNPSTDLQNSITATMNEIASANTKVENELERIPHADFVIDKLDIRSYVGTGATSALSQLLGEQTFLASGQLNQFTQRFAALRQRVTAIITQLDGFDIDLTDQVEDEERLSFTFLGKSAVESIDEVQKRLSDIDDIVRAFARLTGDVGDLKSARVISISKSSPMLVDIALIATGVNGIKPTIVQIGHAIDWTLDRLERLAKIKARFNQLKQDELLTDLMQQELKKLEKDAAIAIPKQNLSVLLCS